MRYRVLIPTAGTGSRLGGLTKYINKSLVSIANRPTISHIIDLFPNTVEFVIALGHKGHLVKEFLYLAYPERKFIYVEVNPFEGPGSGLGLSILLCREHLQQPFIFISCDTLVRNSIPGLEKNWMGFAEISDIDQYRTIRIASGQVQAILEKGLGESNMCKPYIGLAGIKDYATFWDSMTNGGNESISIGESYGMRSLVNSGIQAYAFNWYDTGNPETLNRTRESLKEPNEPNILEKENEAIWFVDNQVIKFSDDKKFIENRVKRAKEISEFVPEVTEATPNMYRYNRASGEILSKVITLPLFEKLLQHSILFWKKRELTKTENLEFRNVCMRFYKIKTEERIELFYKNFGKKDGEEKINGLEVPKLKRLMEMIDWDWLSDGLPGRFHGDFHFENILYSKNNQQFTFLDWRQEFGGSLTTGDIYYDLAKLLHGLIICHELIAADQYSVDWQNDEVCFDFHRKQILVECEQYYSIWLTKNGYDKKKVWTLTAIVYLNIAALHHYPYCLLLYVLGKKILFRTLTDHEDN
jgi:choline kinase